MANLNNEGNKFGINFNAMTTSLLSMQFTNFKIAPGPSRRLVTENSNGRQQVVTETADGRQNLITEGD